MTTAVRHLQLLKIRFLRLPLLCQRVKTLQVRRHYATGINLTKMVMRMDEKVAEELTADQPLYKYKNHPGHVRINVAVLPAKFLDAADHILLDQQIASLDKEAKRMSNYIMSRKPKLEGRALEENVEAIERELLEREVVKRQNASEQPKTEIERDIKTKQFRDKVFWELRKRTYNWEAINYDSYNGLLYMVGRSPPEYAALSQIFSELQSRVPEFKPTGVFDFGSGVGTVIWAAHNRWAESLQEYYAVDTSADIQKIARLLLQGGREDKKSIIRGTFFRQFLPASHTLQYDLVVSSYSLMELPSTEMRLQTLENLWSKTKHFLVLVEYGSNAGHELIVEARDFILQTSKWDCHVFAPCSHDLQCPRLKDPTPCNFEAGYYDFNCRKGGKQIERFSYVVLQKRARPTVESWPRLVRPVLKRTKHVVCQLCCTDGQIRQTVVTSSKHGKSVYRCARNSKWGDLLPVSCAAVDEDQQETEDPTSHSVPAADDNNNK